MDGMGIIVAARTEIARAADVETIAGAAADALAAFGAASVTYLMHRPPAGHAGDPPHFGAHRADWAADYRAGERWRDDPAVIAVRNRVSPFGWRALDDGSLSRRQRETLHSLMSDYGLADGVTAPVTGPGDTAGTLNASIEAGMGADARAQLEIALGAIGAATQERVAALLLERRDHPAAAALTPTQREIVQWMAFGKTSGDVAEILGVNEVTVRRHLAEARARLRCATTAQLVGRAFAWHVVTL